jgi:erythromycin esterase
MKEHNANPAHKIKFRFYGFDIPTGTMGIASPRQVLDFVLNYLASIDKAGTKELRERIEKLLGQDADWENPAAHMDPTKSIGLSPNATAMRIETEDLISKLQAHRPELVEKSDKDSFMEALQHAKVTRQLLNYHGF